MTARMASHDMGLLRPVVCVTPLSVPICWLSERNFLDGLPTGEQVTDPTDIFLLQLEAFAIAARLRRHGEIDAADLVERWASSRELRDQLIPDPSVN